VTSTPQAPPAFAEAICTEAAQSPKPEGRPKDRGGIVGAVRRIELRSLLSRYSDTLVQQALTAGFGVISGVLAPRLLGPKGRGELAAVTLWPLTLVFLSSLGIDRATVFFGAKSRKDSSPVATACLLLGGVQSVIVIIAGLIVIPAALKAYGPGLVRLGIVFLLGAPLVQATSLGSNLLLGRLQTLPYNLGRAIAPGCYAIAVATLFILHIPSVRAIILAQLTGYGIAAWLVIRFVLRRLRPNWSWSGKTVKDMVKYGAKAHAGELSSFMNQRADQLIISLLMPGAQLGIYVAAVAFADGLLIIPRGIGAVTLASGSNSDSQGAWLWARRSIALTALWLAPAAAGLWLACPYLIPHLFGAAFAPSILPCRILILGSCAVGLNTVVGEGLRSINRPEISSYAEGAGLVATVLLLAALLRPYGIVGAAVASTGAYTMALGVAVAYANHFRRRAARTSGIRFPETLIS
jgi:enterobacterial common antigen flippase